VAARRAEKGRSAPQVLAASLPDIITRIPFGKTMRWGEGSFRFARPLQWLVCLFGSEVVPFELAGLSSGRRTRGPRFDRSPVLEIADAKDYMKLLDGHGGAFRKGSRGSAPAWGRDAPRRITLSCWTP
jgi:glycyl-tRNA synthetase beta subunit